MNDQQAPPAEGRRRDDGELLDRPAPGQAAAWTAEKPVAPDEVAAFLSIDGQGGVTVYIGKVDMGTGVRTGFMQIAAEELDVPFARIRVIEGDTR